VTLADVCIRRPVFATVLVLSLVVLGLVSYQRLGLDLFPNIDFPIVTVTTTLRGASVEEIETTVSKIIEEGVNTIDGIDELSSVSKEGVSFVIVQFRLDKNGDVGAQAVRDKVSTVMAQLPIGTDPPVIDRFDVNATPIMRVGVSGKGNFREITEIAKKRIKEELETVPGVGQVLLIGGRERAINVFVDPDRLEAYGLSIAQVRAALVRQNVWVPGGRVQRSGGEWVVRTMGRLEDVRDFGDLVIAELGGRPVRVRDVGYAEDGVVEPRSLTRIDDRSAVQLVIRKQSGANTVDVVDHVVAKLNELRRALPPDIQYEVARDQSRFIRLSIAEVKRHLVLGAILVAITVLVFMHDFRSTLIASIAIPASIISTFTVMYYFGFTLNNVTMLALVLSVGIVIDDAVVVLENIYRYVEEKAVEPMRAASEATREIALAVMATTLSLVIIFLPVAFMGGRVGRFFSSFGITTAVAILISLLISFTLTPTLSSRFLRSKGKEKGSKQSFLFSRIDRAYGRLLRASLRHRWAVVLVAVGVLASTPMLFKLVGKDFLAADDQSEFEIIVQAPGGYTLDQTSALLTEIEEKVKRLRGVTGLVTTVGDTQGRLRPGEGDVTIGSIYVRLVDLADRAFTQFDVMADARRLLADYPDVRSSVQSVNIFAGQGQRLSEVEFNLLGPDVEGLKRYSDQILARMQAIPGIVDADTTMSSRVPELRVSILRDRAADLGVRVADIADTLRIYVGGEAISKYREQDNQYDVWLRAIPERRRDVGDLYNLALPSASGRLVKLANLVEIRPDLGPSQIDRFNRNRKVTLVANLLPGLPLGTAIEKIQGEIAKLELPAEYSIAWTGRAKSLGETAGNFAIAFALSIVFMYMVLAAQFESFIHPVTIMLALPLTIPCGLAGLVLLHEPMNIYSVFGFFMLFGIVKKNGILQIDYTNTLRARGMERDGAILEANHVRLRPILMTTMMLMAGMIPIALGRGPGTGSRASIAKVIIGGQAISLVITLLITPVAYSLFDDLRNGRPWSRLRRRPPVEPAREASAEIRKIASL
jgi:hydrophobic/amphiphilic exporter-1 (mainly G- bacteria), HAE1 family